MTYFGVNLGMTLTVILFALGYLYRKTDNKKHRLLMTAAVAVFLITAVFLVVSIHLFFGGDMRAAGFYPTVTGWIITVHRVIAVLVVLVMFAMVYTGATGRRNLHIQLHRFFIPSYLVIYISGILIFSGTP